MRGAALITYGCDASRWQGLLDWRALRRKGIEFAALRATMGLSGLDPLYSAQRSAAEAAGVLVISYGLIYPRPGTGAAQAQHLVRTSGAKAGSILALDVEPPDGEPPALAAVWREVVYDAACETSKLCAFPPLIYGSPSFLRALDLPYDMWGAPLWIADWRARLLPEVPGPWKRATIRQTGLAPSSISATPLDYDCFEGTLDELRDAASWRM